MHCRDITTFCFWKQTAAISFYFRFNSNLSTAIGMWFCTDILDFMQIGSLPTVLWHRIDFPRRRPWRHKSTSGFWFDHASHLRRPKAIGVSNFDQISQSTAEILLLPVSVIEWPPYWNSTSGFNFDLSTVIGIVVQNFIGIGSSEAEL